ncbi:hypothetical protein [Lutibacter sp.]|uniref:HYC_CC_PP family protein n=1 Tax=Lutibacter sp. TaxID=1925666 RepID=UPI00356944F2
MKDIFRKISAILMVAILLLSTTSFAVFTHFCNGNIVAVSTKKVDSCCESENTIKTDNLNYSEKDCCKNETSIKEVLPFDNLNSVKIIKSQTLFLTSFYYSFIEKSTLIRTTKNYYKDFSPPNLVLNKQVLFQTFLI